MILIIKAFCIGTFGAGGFYFVMSFVFHYFPMPTLLNIRAMLLGWTSSKYKEKGDWAEKVWQIGRWLLIAIIFLCWLALYGLYAYLLHRVLHHYIAVGYAEFWSYYGIAISLPTLWVLYKSWDFFNHSDKKDVNLDIDDAPSDRTLLERMTS